MIEIQEVIYHIHTVKIRDKVHNELVNIPLVWNNLALKERIFTNRVLLDDLIGEMVNSIYNIIDNRV